MRHLFSVLFCMLLTGLLTACATDERRNFEISESMNGSSIRCSKGDTIRISLPSNPTTGYVWMEPVYPDTDVLRLVNDSHKTPPGREKLCGAPGTRILLYQAAGPGDTGIRLEYRRPWESAPPEKTFELRVQVRRIPQSKLFNDEYETPRINSKGQIEPKRNFRR